MGMIRRIVFSLVLLGTVCLCRAGVVGGELVSEVQFGWPAGANAAAMLRLEGVFGLPWKVSLEMATVHVARAREHILPDLQGFSNIEEETAAAAVAVLGVSRIWGGLRVFAGVRNVNEDYFVTDGTGLFTGSSCGIFPTISGSYPIANYPLSSLGVHVSWAGGGWSVCASLYNGRGYNGWSGDDNPFVFRPAEDGVFCLGQACFEDAAGVCVAGAAVHSRCCSDGAGCVLWAYCERRLLCRGPFALDVVAGYSENLCRSGGCRRYFQAGLVFDAAAGRLGLSFQNAVFRDGTERSLELTWRMSLGRMFWLQPAFHCIFNPAGSFAVLCARFGVDF